MFKSSSPFMSVLVLLFLTSTFNRFLCFWAESHHRVWFHLIDLSHWGQDIDERISFRDLFPIFFGCISETKSKKDIPSQIKKKFFTSISSIYGAVMTKCKRFVWKNTSWFTLTATILELHLSYDSIFFFWTYWSILGIFINDNFWWIYPSPFNDLLWVCPVFTALLKSRKASFVYILEWLL